MYNGTMKSVIARPGYRLEEMIFITRGSLGLYNTLTDQKWPGIQVREQTPFTIMPAGSIWGDYQLLFDLSPVVEVRPFIPNNGTTIDILQQVEQFDGGIEPEFYETMCLRKDRLAQLCDLFPKTANTLKY